MIKLSNLFTKPKPLELSINQYLCPIPSNIPIKNILYDWPSHQGRYRGAVDFAVDAGTPVLVPQDGTIIEIVDHHRIHGPGKAFIEYLNYITIMHANGEYSQLAHLQQGSVQAKIGDKVTQGQLIAHTGLNGWMEEPFLEHLHFYVFKKLPNNDFIGLKIQYIEEPIETTIESK